MTSRMLKPLSESRQTPGNLPSELPIYRHQDCPGREFGLDVLTVGISGAIIIPMSRKAVHSADGTLKHFDPYGSVATAADKKIGKCLVLEKSGTLGQGGATVSPP
jgi:hypothetical protein